MLNFLISGKYLLSGNLIMGLSLIKDITRSAKLWLSVA